MIRLIFNKFHFLFLIILVFLLYYKFFLFGKIPFPGDLLVGSYSPWFDYYKIPVQNPIISDVFSQLILWKYLSIDIFRSGQWPLWNPYSFTGTPFLASYQSATLYPLNILLLLPKYFGWGIFIFSQTLLAAINVYLFVGLYVKSKLARLTGAIIFALAGLMTTWVEQGIPVHGILWLPLCLYLIEKFKAEKKLRYLLFLVGTLSFTILAGHAQMFIYTFVITFMYALVITLKGSYKTFLGNFLPIVLSLILGLLVCAPQLLPTLELLNKSIRISESYIGEFNFGLLPLQDVIKFFLADFFGNPVTRNYWGFLNYFEANGFLGTLTLPLLLFAYIYLKRFRVTSFFLFLLPISLIFTFVNPISHTLYSSKIPLLTSSYASRMLFITSFAAACLSAFAIGQIIEDKKSSKLLKLGIFSWAAILGIFIGTILSQKIIQIIIKNSIPKIHGSLANTQVNSYLDTFIKDGNYISSNISVAMRNSIIPVLLISLFLILFVLVRKVRLGLKINQTTLICTALFVLLTVDLGRYFLKFNPFVAENLIFPNIPALQFLQSQREIFRIGREHAEVFPPNTWIAYNLQSLEGYDPLYLNQYAKFMNFLNGVDLKSGSSSRYAEITQNYSSTHIDAANVRFFIGVLRDKSGRIPGDLIDYRLQKTGYKKVFQDKSAVILENQNALERVYFAQSVTVASPTQTEDIYTSDLQFDPRKQILLSKDLGVVSVTGKGSATITHYSPNVVKIVTKTQSDEILVLADQYDDGWLAKIDGIQTQISKANLTFRAVKAPKGEHEFIFYYWPKSFEAGVKISAVTILVIALAALFLSFRKNMSIIRSY